MAGKEIMHPEEAGKSTGPSLICCQSNSPWESFSLGVIHIATHGHQTPPQTVTQLQGSHGPGVVAALPSELEWCIIFPDLSPPQYTFTQMHQVHSVVGHLPLQRLVPATMA